MRRLTRWRQRSVGPWHGRFRTSRVLGAAVAALAVAVVPGPASGTGPEGPGGAAADAVGRRGAVTDPAGTARVPAETARRTQLGLVSATPSLLIADQRVLGLSHLLLGTTESQLTPAVLPESLDTAVGSADLDWDIADRVLYRPVVAESGGAETVTLHRYDLLSHAESSTGLTSVGEYLAAVQTGWIGRSGSTMVLHEGELATPFLDDLDASGGLADIAEDADGVLLAYQPVGMPDRSQLVLLDLETRQIRRIDAVSGLGGVALSPGFVAWTSRDTDGGATLYRQPRAGGETVTRRIATRGLSSAPDVAITDSSSLWRDETSQSLRLLPATVGASPTTLTLPGRNAGYAAVGDIFYTAVSGDLATAGIYTVHGATGVTRRTSTVSAPVAEYRGMAMTSRYLYYVDDSDTSTAGLPLRRRRVVGTTALTLGPAEPLSPRVGDRGISASATRLLVGKAGADSTAQLLDGGQVDGEYRLATQAGRTKVSGPYLLTDSAVYRADGRKMMTVAATWKGTDLFGARVVYASRAGGVRIRDLAAPVSSSNPRLLGPCTSCLVSTWGNQVAWATSGTSVTVLDLATRDTRTVSNIPVRSLVLGDGVLAWTERAANRSLTRLKVLDLTTSRSTPVLISSGILSLQDGAVLDDHRIAWVDRSGEMRVAPLPFGTPHQPRLVGALASAAISPNGDGTGDAWTPEFDVTKPVEDVILTVTHGTTVVRTRNGTGAEGGIRDLTWDGRDTAGTLVADGTYGWKLTAVAIDDEGTLAPAEGTGTVTGTVAVDRTPLTTVASAPSVNATASRKVTFPVSWRARGATTTNPADRYDVRYRRVSRSGGAVRYGEIVTWYQGTTKRSATFAPSSLSRGTAWQFSARTVDAAGNIGPWSAWDTTAVARDDRDGTRKGSWRRIGSDSAYLGSVSGTTARNASLTFGSRAASVVTVVGARCRSCGKFRVYVDGHPVRTVDTRGTGARKTLCTLKVAPGRHQVRIVNLATAGRGQILIDAVGYTP